jgi:hypothetical protein
LLMTAKSYRDLLTNWVLLFSGKWNAASRWPSQLQFSGISVTSSYVVLVGTPYRKGAVSYVAFSWGVH